MELPWITQLYVEECVLHGWGGGIRRAVLTHYLQNLFLLLLLLLLLITCFAP